MAVWRTRASPGAGGGTSTSSQRMTSGVPLAWIRMALGMGDSSQGRLVGPPALAYCVASDESCGGDRFARAAQALNSPSRFSKGKPHEQAQGAIEVRQGLPQRVAGHPLRLLG